MDNHYHLIIETLDASLSKGMRQLNGVYTQSINQKYNRVGHIFQGRYKAILIQKETHLLEVCRYIMLNPVRANLINSPGDWKWSSYRATAGFGMPHDCLTIDRILNQFSPQKSLASKKYIVFVNDDKDVVSPWAYLKGRTILGDDNFIKQFDDNLQNFIEVKEIPKSQRFASRPPLEKLFDKDMKDREKRNRKIKEAILMYGYTQKEIADYLGIHYSTISKLVNY